VVVVANVLANLLVLYIVEAKGIIVLPTAVVVVSLAIFLCVIF
jgi:hypothetical protein